MAERAVLMGMTDARKRLRELIEEIPQHDIVLLRHNRPAAVLTAPERLEELYDKIEDLEDQVASLLARLDPERTPHEDVMERLGLTPTTAASA